ncbi:MAG: DNA-binding transcriptional regulator [Kiritimatiellales bacterium]|jgi:LacI family transcriptional regulator
MKSAIPRIMILMDPARGYDRALMRGMAHYVHTAGPVQFFQPPPFWERWDHYSLVEFIQESKVDGMILIEREDIDALLKLKIPMVVSPYNRRKIAKVINLVTDHQAVGRLAADHLLQSGFRQFAFCGYNDMFWSDERLAGFKARLSEEGFVPDVYTGKASSPSDEKVRLLIWLNKLPVPTGIMACADERGRELVELCVSSSIRVPDEIGVIGVDDDELLCDLAPVPLSSVANTAEQCGFEAVKRIVQLLENRSRALLKPDIVVEPNCCVGRRSTDFINTEDAALAKAVRFIREHVREPVGVEDVAQSCGLSRRVLEKRFRKNLGISIYAEIRRVRVDLFARLLLESTRTVAEISEQLGFEGIEHVSRYFKAQTGMTPREYRLRYGRG